MRYVELKRGQAARIGDGIAVTVLGISPTIARLGVLAPRDVAIDRAETRAAIAGGERRDGRSTPRAGRRAE